MTFNISKYALIVLAILGTIVACNQVDSGNSSDASSEPVEVDKAQEIVDKAITAINGSLLEQVEIAFRFRVRDYIYKKNQGAFEYTRIHVDTNDVRTVDVLTNNALVRTIDGEVQELDSTWTSRYSNSVNGVIYFSFLPFRLNDGAVLKTYQGETTIKGKQYHEVLVQFEQEGGGKDHDDNFLYWFDTETYALDYFAYDYLTDGGGVRFREAFNRRNVNGLEVQDYINYKPSREDQKLEDMASSFTEGTLVELSRIELVDVNVTPL